MPPPADIGAADPDASVTADLSPSDVANGATFALQSGHSWDEVSGHLQDNAPDAPQVQQPSIGEVWYGLPTMERPSPGEFPLGRNDQINSGAGPVGEALLGLASGSVTGIVRGMVAGAGGAVAEDAAQVVSARAAQMGVAPSTAGLSGTQSEMDFALRDFVAPLGNKWVRRGLAAQAFANTYYPYKSTSGDK